MSKEPYIDPQMFTKPPPNFKDPDTKWNSFRVPPGPTTVTCAMYNENLASNHYTHNPPPNFPSGNFRQQSQSPENNVNKNKFMFDPGNMVQPFKPEVPPPPFKKNLSTQIKSSDDTSTPKVDNVDNEKSSYYLTMVYRLQNSHNASQPPPSSNSFTNPNSLSKPFLFPPPLTHMPPPQPPLPPLPPPQVPPPPPPTAAHRSPQKHRMGNYHKVSPYSPYATNYSKPHGSYKRKFEGNDLHKKLNKKKKKPLSQIVPQRRDWTFEDAKRALEVEKECNKRIKKKGLIIKFPDLDLNRETVTNFHTSIESVHFQLPSTPRYCFVTLTPSADPDTVIKQLNQIRFGLGYLSAEIKKDREDELNIRPSDIDPLTLYVGNLAQEITKDDMTRAYPKQKRIDIGYAKKMKFTRYAFVSFHTVDEAIEAFQNTHSTQMYSKSLIVRFRRLHGTVGMPGEPKQNPSFRSEAGNSTISKNGVNKMRDPWDLDISHWENDTEEKCARLYNFTSDDDDDEDEDEVDIKPPIPIDITSTSTFKPGSLEVAISLHRPKIFKEENQDNRAEPVNLEENVQNDDLENDSGGLSSVFTNPEDSPVDDENPNPPSKESQILNGSILIKTEKEPVSFPSSSTSYDYLRNLNHQIRTGTFPPLANETGDTEIPIKKEQEASVGKDLYSCVDIVAESEVSSQNMENNEVNDSAVSSNIDPYGNDEQESASQTRVVVENGTAPKESENCLPLNLTQPNSSSFNETNAAYPLAKIKTENSDGDDGVHDEDDDSSDDDWSMGNIFGEPKKKK